MKFHYEGKAICFQGLIASQTELIGDREFLKTSNCGKRDLLLQLVSSIVSLIIWGMKSLYRF